MRRLLPFLPCTLSLAASACASHDNMRITRNEDWNCPSEATSERGDFTVQEVLDAATFSQAIVSTFNAFEQDVPVTVEHTFEQIGPEEWSTFLCRDGVGLVIPVVHRVRVEYSSGSVSHSRELELQAMGPTADELFTSPPEDPALFEATASPAVFLDAKHAARAACDDLTFHVTPHPQVHAPWSLVREGGRVSVAWDRCRPNTRGAGMLLQFGDIATTE